MARHDQDSSPVYCGRLVGVFRDPAGRLGVAYRVSSRSFPNRRAVKLPDGARIDPIDPAELAANPYIAYRCLRHAEALAVASNGSHTDAVFERIAAGMPPRDAIALALLAFDYEHDALNTPRIVAAVARGSPRGYLGTVRASGLAVEEIELAPGRVWFVATYELDRIGDPRGQGPWTAKDAEAGAAALFSEPPFSALAKPVCGACAVEGRAGFDVAVGAPRSA
jgi:IMP cyclohydrolase